MSAACTADERYGYLIGMPVYVRRCRLFPRIGLRIDRHVSFGMDETIRDTVVGTPFPLVCSLRMVCTRTRFMSTMHRLNCTCRIQDNFCDVDSWCDHIYLFFCRSCTQEGRQSAWRPTTCEVCCVYPPTYLPPWYLTLLTYFSAEANFDIAQTHSKCPGKQPHVSISNAHFLGTLRDKK